MQINSETSGSLRAEELAYVTVHLGDLQGLAIAPFMAAFAAWAMWIRLHGSCLPQLWLLVTALPASIVAAVAIRRWYGARFGYVKSGDEFAVPSGLTLLSLSGPETVVRRRARYGAQSQPKSIVLLWGILLLLELGLLAGSHGHMHSSSMLVPVTFLLLPRCSFATPASLPLQLRRALSIAALAMFLTLQMMYVFGPLSKWGLLGDVFCSYFALAAYDHWLLTHFLPGARSGLEDACGS